MEESVGAFDAASCARRLGRSSRNSVSTVAVGESSFEFRGPNPEDLGAFTDARVAALKAGLRLTPEQEKNWPAFEQAYRNLAKLRTDRFAARSWPGVRSRMIRIWSIACSAAPTR